MDRAAPRLVAATFGIALDLHKPSFHVSEQPTARIATGAFSI